MGIDIQKYSLEIYNRCPKQIMPFRIFKFLAMFFPDKIKHYCHPLLPWRQIFHYLAIYHPEYIEKYKHHMETKFDNTIRGMVLPLCKYHPEYIEVYKDLFNINRKYIWRKIKEELKKFNPEWSEYYESKGYFDD